MVQTTNINFTRKQLESFRYCNGNFKKLYFSLEHCYLLEEGKTTAFYCKTKLLTMKYLVLFSSMCILFVREIINVPMKKLPKEFLH